jgi:hypothetical protein
VRAIEALLRSFDKLAPLLAKVDEINAAIKRVLDRILHGDAPSTHPHGDTPTTHPGDGPPTTHSSDGPSTSADGPTSGGGPTTGGGSPPPAGPHSSLPPGSDPATPPLHPDPDAPRPADGHVEPGRPPADPWPVDPPQPKPLDPRYVDHDLVDAFDPTTAPDEATFWSGRIVVDGKPVPNATQEGAQLLTEGTHGSTLEQILDEQGLTDRMPTDWDSRSTHETWAAISTELAENASGDVRAYVGDVRAESVWNTYELPTLLNNPNVTSITIIDAYTGRIVQIFER